jgi:hypothetical protein
MVTADMNPGISHGCPTIGSPLRFRFCPYLFAVAACRSAAITSEVFHSFPGQYRKTVPSVASKIVFIE